LGVFVLPEPKEESWPHFGWNIENFLLLNKEKLIDNDFDLFIGFSRGGVILSNILSCIIKDKFEHYKKDILKLSLRSIPNGIYSKSDEICFLINKTATEAELDDIHEYLKKDLEKFYSEHFKEKKQQKLNILVIDDNLTGSTRIFAAKHFLEQLNFVGIVKTLAYTRVKDFKVPKLDYQIRDYPENALFFIMPWHYVHIEHQHPILQNKDTATTLFFKFLAQDNIKFGEIVEEIEQTIPYNQVNKHDDEDFEIKDCVNFRIGTSDLALYYNSLENIIEIHYYVIKIYPPKACLTNNSMFETPLCKDSSKEKITNDLCTLCTILNCNKQFFKILLNKGDFSNFNIDYLYEDQISEYILAAVNSWFLKHKSEIGIKS
jgi:hypoxanthine phosphoribosyltransferase